VSVDGPLFPLDRSVNMLLDRRGFLSAGAALLTGCAGGTQGGPEPTPSTPAVRGVASAARARARSVLPTFSPKRLREMQRRLDPLHERTGAPRPGEWRADHPEPGQSFDEYLASGPTAPVGGRRSLVVQPLGAIDETRTRILGLVGEALTAHFGLPARLEEPLEIAPPRDARRRVERTTQLLSGWVLHSVLKPRLPTDAAALLGFTTEDLWPGSGWNFVFGEASLQDRVGVWSLHRYGDPTIDPGAFKETLRRAVKVALHETGHMFSLEHCTRYRCVQAGINSLEEEDRAPMWLCPDCLAKISWVTSTDPRSHLRAMADFCRRAELRLEVAHYEKDLAALG
jgi:archaemetzincin